MTNELQGPPAELRFVLTVKRKDTGKVETYEMAGYTKPAEQTESTDGSDTQHGSAQRSD
jgi:hypothetical protein